MIKPSEHLQEYLRNQNIDVTPIISKLQYEEERFDDKKLEQIKEEKIIPNRVEQVQVVKPVIPNLTKLDI